MPSGGSDSGGDNERTQVVARQTGRQRPSRAASKRRSFALIFKSPMVSLMGQPTMGDEMYAPHPPPARWPRGHKCEHGPSMINRNARTSRLATLSKRFKGDSKLLRCAEANARKVGALEVPQPSHSRQASVDRRRLSSPRGGPSAPVDMPASRQASINASRAMATGVIRFRARRHV